MTILVTRLFSVDAGLINESSSLWNKNWQGKPKNLKKIHPNAISYEKTCRGSAP
jgi:hypothetical protein